jgi:hypothetical protein
MHDVIGKTLLAQIYAQTKTFLQKQTEQMKGDKVFAQIKNLCAVHQTLSKKYCRVPHAIFKMPEFH